MRVNKNEVQYWRIMKKDGFLYFIWYYGLLQMGTAILLCKYLLHVLFPPKYESFMLPIEITEAYLMGLFISIGIWLINSFKFKNRL